MFSGDECVVRSGEKAGRIVRTGALRTALGLYALPGWSQQAPDLAGKEPGRPDGDVGFENGGAAFANRTSRKTTIPGSSTRRELPGNQASGAYGKVAWTF
jgi:hypothetical protein